LNNLVEAGVEVALSPAFGTLAVAVPAAIVVAGYFVERWPSV